MKRNRNLGYSCPIKNANSINIKMSNPIDIVPQNEIFKSHSLAVKIGRKQSAQSTQDSQKVSCHLKQHNSMAGGPFHAFTAGLASFLILGRLLLI